jgi:hypothetical protein
LLERERRSAAAYGIDLAGEPRLQNLLGEVAQQMGAAAPQRVLVTCDVRVAHRRRGGGELMIGLPLVACLTEDELAGLLASHLALARRGSAAGAIAWIRGINAWLWHSVYGQSRLDQWLSVVAQRQHFHVSKLLLPLSVLNWPPRVVLFVPMFIANTIGAGVIRRAEQDADRLAARLIGLRAFGGLLERQELIDFAWEGVLAELEFLHREQQLPASLAEHLALRMQDMTPELRAVLGETVNKPAERPFDSRASREERMQALAGEPATGVLQCSRPAKGFLIGYEALTTTMTRDYYAGRFGGQLLGTAMRRSS